MSVRAVNEFLKRLDADPSMLQEFFESIPRDIASGAPVVAFAARHGFEFSEEDFCEIALVPALDGELGEAELETVVGGVGPMGGGSFPGRSANGAWVIGGRVYQVEPAGSPSLFGS